MRPVRGLAGGVFVGGVIGSLLHWWYNDTTLRASEIVIFAIFLLLWDGTRRNA